MAYDHLRQIKEGETQPFLNRVARASLVAVFAAFGLSACSAVPDWANPIAVYDGIIGNDDGIPDDLPEPPKKDFPELTSVPDRPTPSLTVKERDRVAEGLISDRNRVQYTDEVLRGGTDMAAPPPPPPARPVAAAPTEPIESVGEAPTASVGDDASTPEARPIAPVEVKPIEESRYGPPLMRPVLALSRMPARARSGAVKARNRELVVNTAAEETVETASLGILMNAPGYGSPAIGGPLIPVGDLAADASLTTPGFESDRSVIVNLAALPRSPGWDVTGRAVGRPITVRFRQDSLRINREGQSAIAELADNVVDKETGFLRVVGHSSSRTQDMPVEEHLMVNFESSLRRAETVAKALVANGVLAEKIIVEAVSDSQPIFYESMPSGEALNQRVEIFVQ
jgi:outer membrane protein OmpA-like peptidoglycan-associated protein